MEDCLSHFLRPSRREVITGAGASALALTAGPGFAARSLVASGVVFEDRSGDGIRQPGDAASRMSWSQTAAMLS